MVWGVSCRLIIAADKVLVFEPDKKVSVQFVNAVARSLTASEGARMMRKAKGLKACDTDEDVPEHPFELEMLERALQVATGIFHQTLTLNYSVNKQ